MTNKVDRDKKALEYFKGLLQQKKMRLTKQREVIVRLFLEKEGHLCAEELYLALRKQYPRLGEATVYRTVKLLKAAELASEVNFTGKRRRFEHAFGHPHHDHLICLGCGKTEEFVNQSIEKIQERVVRQYGFAPTRHRLEIFGYCRDCRTTE
jgi:Fur family ferric uptake transcriptional regulator